jgi:Peptidase family M1 domain
MRKPALAMLLTMATAAFAQTATNSPTPLSTRVVMYGIDARVDTAKKTVDANETLTYKNLTGQPLSTFPFHLYLNAFQPDSTFTTETHFGGGIRDSESADEYPDKKRGSITITRLTTDAMPGDLTPLLQFIAPDDGNKNDRTVAQLTLPKALDPGESITFRISFHDQFPESVARNGYKRDFMMGGQWYPKLGVFWHGSWNCHQYHATTEFFSDFATFDVRLTLPKNYTVGASGVPTGDQANSDGTRTLSYYGEDIHDFAWAASPHFTVTDGTFLSSMGPVKVHVLALAAHPKAGKRYLDITLASLKQFDDRFGPYPYKMLTVIDPEPGSEMEGMEYPTLITAGTTLFDPTHLTELVTEHEFGHQYWYGMVATNEFEDAWLDEGINSYTEVNVTAAILGRETNVISSPWMNMSDASLQYYQYLFNTNYDPVTRHAWQFRDSGSYGAVTYGKSATLLKTLEGIIGRDTMDEAMRTYFMRYRFTHPTTEDFLRTIEEVAIERGRASGMVTRPPQLSVPENDRSLLAQNLRSLASAGQSTIINSSLRPFFEQAVYGTDVLDYAIDEITSDPLEWWVADSNNKKMRDTVTVHRVGDFILPVTIQVVFSDGKSVIEYWNPREHGADGNDRWKTFTYIREAKVVSAEIDPDHTVLLDTNRFNNSRTVDANPVPARKLTNLWMTAMQFGSQIAGWLV